MRVYRGQAARTAANGWRTAALLAGTALALGLRAADAAPAGPTVNTANGQVTGVAATYAATKYAPTFTVNNFFGIPYAAPPVGVLRWKPPQPPANWTAPLAISCERTIVLDISVIEPLNWCAAEATVSIRSLNCKRAVTWDVTSVANLTTLNGFLSKS